MSTHKNFDKICVAVLVLTLFLTVLFMNGRRLGIEVVVDEDDEAHSGAVYFTANDLNGNWDSSEATVITLEGESASVSGKGAYVYRSDVFINSAGLYVLSGELTDGRIVVDARNSSKVWLLFDGVSLNCSDDACLRVEQADKVFLTLAEGSENSMSGAVVFSDAAAADGTDGVIYAHDDLTINGGGRLTVNAWYRHGIVAKDDLVITGGTIIVKSQADGIRANDSLRVCGAEIMVEAGDDGIAVAGEGGYLYLESGSFTVISEDDALSAVGPLMIAGGDLTLTPVGDAIRSDTAVYLAGGTVFIDNCYEGVEAPVIELSGGDVVIYPRDDGFNASASAISGSTRPQVLIRGGALTIVNETAQDSDGIDSNGDIVISGGVIRVSLPGSGINNAIDCGSESGGTCEISGGSVIACGSSSMAEGFDESSTQCSIFYALNAPRAAGTAVSLTEASGETLLSWDVPCSFSSLTLSAPELLLGESYTLHLGDTSEDFTVSGSVTALGSQSAAGGLPGMGGMGMPAPPSDGAFPGGDTPGMGERPELPEGGFPEGDAPPSDGAFPGALPDMGDRPEPPGSATPLAPGGENAGAAASAAVTVDVSTWLLIGAAALILALGILLGARFEPKE